MINPFTAVWRRVVGVEQRTVAHVVADFHRMIDDLKAVEQKASAEAAKLEQALLFHRGEAIKAQAVAAQIAKIVNV